VSQPGRAPIVKDLALEVSDSRFTATRAHFAVEGGKDRYVPMPGVDVEAMRRFDGLHASRQVAVSPSGRQALHRGGRQCRMDAAACRRMKGQLAEIARLEGPGSLVRTPTPRLWEGGTWLSRSLRAQP